MTYKKKTVRDNVEVVIALGFTSAQVAADEYFRDTPSADKVWVLAADPSQGIASVETLVVRLDK